MEKLNQQYYEAGFNCIVSAEQRGHQVSTSAAVIRTVVLYCHAAVIRLNIYVAEK